MKKLSDFIGPVNTRAMNVRVIRGDGLVTQTFDAPQGFQLERYVDSLYPENELMVYETKQEVNISVIHGHDVAEVYVGIYK